MTQPQEVKGNMSDRVARHQSWDKGHLRPSPEPGGPGQRSRRGGLNLPGMVTVRVVSSRNLSVQYTDGLECTRAWLRAGKASTGLLHPALKQVRAPPSAGARQDGEEGAGLLGRPGGQARAQGGEDQRAGQRHGACPLF